MNSPGEKWIEQIFHRKWNHLSYRCMRRYFVSLIQRCANWKFTKLFSIQIDKDQRVWGYSVEGVGKWTPADTASKNVNCLREDESRISLQVTGYSSAPRGVFYGSKHKNAKQPMEKTLHDQIGCLKRNPKPQMLLVEERLNALWPSRLSGRRTARKESQGLCVSRQKDLSKTLS